MNIYCNPIAVTFVPSTFGGEGDAPPMLIHFEVRHCPNKGAPFWIELGKLGLIRLVLRVIIGDRATYAVDAWRPAGASVPPEEPLFSAFLDLPKVRGA